MARRGDATRDRILDAAHRHVLDHGYAASSLDRILEDAGVTKGAFFHHFDSKAALAEALARRYAAAETAHLDALFARAAALAPDPLSRVLLVVGLLAEAVEAMAPGDPGCLLASYCYEKDLLTPEVRGILAESVAAWRTRFAAALREAAAEHPPAKKVDLELLADHGTVVLEGAFVLARVERRAGTVTSHLRVYRSLLEAVFAAGARPSPRRPRRRARTAPRPATPRRAP
jgi:TetR/AcrR family transcriptional repressor of nem operon